MYVSKDALNHFLVYFRAKNSFRSANNLAFSLFCILVYRPRGAVPLRATLLDIGGIVNSLSETQHFAKHW